MSDGALREIEARATAAEERADAAQAALRNMEEFLALLGHELRNPLAAVRMGLTLLEQELGANPRSEKVRAAIARQNDLMVRLVDDLLDLARITHGKIALEKTVVDLRDVVENAVEAARPDYARMGVTLVSEVGATPARVHGDPTRLQQVMANVLDNALKYTPEGGRVRTEVAVHEGIVRVSIADSGVGIEAAKLANLFHLFVQGDTVSARRDGGLGIGLTVVRRLVALHGGTVRLTSPGIGLGAELTIDLPAAGVGTPIVRPSRPVERAHPESKRLRILLVDDHEDTRDLFAAYLELAGHEVQTAKDGAEAMQRLGSEHFDAAVVDIGLPDLDGFSVAAWVRSAGYALRLVALTGYGGTEDQLRGRDAGFDEFLVKPVEAQRLLAALLR